MTKKTNRATGKKREREIAAIHEGVGWKVQQAVQSVRFLGPGRYFSHQADLWGVGDMACLRLDSKTLIIQSTNLDHATDRQRKAEDALQNYLNSEATILQVWIWNITKEYGYHWEVRQFRASERPSLRWIRIGRVRRSGLVLFNDDTPATWRNMLALQLTPTVHIARTSIPVAEAPQVIS